MRKSKNASGKKTAITAVALELFMEKGYENTSIRMIQNKVGSEMGFFIIVSRIRMLYSNRLWTCISTDIGRNLIQCMHLAGGIQRD